VQGAQPLEGELVVDLTRYLPGAFASSDLLRLGARVVRVEPPGGDPMRAVDPAWHDALNGGKESVAVDLRRDPDLVFALCRRADVLLTSYRPGVAERIGLEPGPRTVWVELTGFGIGSRHELRAGHDLNYLGWAGALAATAPATPPVPVADYAGAYAAVREALAGLLERARTGEGSRRMVSMTHESARMPVPPILTGAAACYRTYATADGRWLTVAALEPRFFGRLCELVGLPALAGRGYEPRLPELEARLAERPLAEWLELFDGEDVCAGPVATPAEAAEFRAEPPGRAPEVGEHTEAWRRELAQE
jgi:crotonobetainyl-CoA:carnitine CoA-transferase CaiB-like acyl-CoA transferase